MVVGICGMGKLGLPVGLAIESKGHEVIGYDIRQEPYDYIRDRAIPYIEEGASELLSSTRIEMVKSLGDLVLKSDLVLLPVQTPHEQRFEGITALPDDREDFNYAYLKEAVIDIKDTSKMLEKETTLAVISTCLPGTYRREIEPILNDNIDYIYTPQFIAMGTTIKDFLNPEFVLCGADKPHRLITEFYNSLHGEDKTFWTDITTAEAIKVFYNTIITAKTVLGNAMGEMAHKVGADADDIYAALSLATNRIISPKYLRSGVADGGGCHPRDNIALSYMAEKLDMSHNVWEDLMHAREDHMAWLGRVGVELAIENELPLIILGKSFKPETNIETGSPATLMKNLIEDSGFEVSQYEDLEELEQAIYIIGTQHQKYKNYKFPKGSKVIDPFRYIGCLENVEIVRIGGKLSTGEVNG